jgi:hypothetical protein
MFIYILVKHLKCGKQLLPYTLALIRAVMRVSFLLLLYLCPGCEAPNADAFNMPLPLRHGGPARGGHVKFNASRYTQKKKITTAFLASRFPPSVGADGRTTAFLAFRFPPSVGADGRTTAFLASRLLLFVGAGHFPKLFKSQKER